MKTISLKESAFCSGGAEICNRSIEWMSGSIYLSDINKYVVIALSAPGDTYEFKHKDKKCTFTYNPDDIIKKNLHALPYSIATVYYTTEEGSKPSEKKVCGTTYYRLYI